jgi:hypothetical protein
MTVFTDILSLSIIGAFVIWMVLSVLNQHPQTRRLVSRFVYRDVCSLVPIWTFFAPHPGRTDVHLFYRDRDADGQVTEWREITLERRTAALSLWNPRRRISKGVIDVAPDLVKGTNYKAKEPVPKQKVLGFPYLILLNYVCCQPIDFRAKMRQFAVARTNGIAAEENPEVVFLSAFHKLQHIIL